MFEKYRAVDGCRELPDVERDRKTAKRIGQYRVSRNALYYADGTYVPLSDISDITREEASVLTKGCCGIVLQTMELVFYAGGRKRRIIVDSEKQAGRLRAAIGNGGENEYEVQ